MTIHIQGVELKNTYIQTLPPVGKKKVTNLYYDPDLGIPEIEVEV